MAKYGGGVGVSINIWDSYAISHSNAFCKPISRLDTCKTLPFSRLALFQKSYYYHNPRLRKEVILEIIFKEGPLYPLAKLIHVKIVARGFSHVMNKHRNSFTFTQKSRKFMD